MRNGYIVLNDIHYGVGKVPSNLITLSLKNTLNNYDLKASPIHTIYIAGDLTDKLLLNTSEAYKDMMDFGMFLGRYCEEHDIKLRMLEGTPLHDRGQMSLFEKAYSSFDIDFKYINDIHIEYRKDLDAHILYVPDEIRPTAVETEDAIRKLMKKIKIDKVETAIIHGMFTYQMPYESDKKLSEDFFLSIVNGHIHIGHIHQYSNLDRIYAGGSWDRVSQNDDGKKGGTVTTYSNITKTYVTKRLYNKYSTPFVTVKVKDTFNPVELAEEIMQKAYRQSSMPVKINVRILSKNKSTANVIEYLPFKFHFDISVEDEVKPKKLQSSDEEEGIYNEVKRTQFNINESTLFSLITDKAGMTFEEIELLKEEFSRNEVLSKALPKS